MQKAIFFILILLVFAACKDDDPVDPEIVGTYSLIEVLTDPGNGSGTFQAVTSSKTITFDANGTVSSNGDLCTSSIQSNAPSAGTYSLIDSTISSSSCGNGAPFDIQFKLQAADTLIISYPCIEPCRAKFVR